MGTVGTVARAFSATPSDSPVSSFLNGSSSPLLSNQHSQSPRIVPRRSGPAWGKVVGEGGRRRQSARPPTWIRSGVNLSREPEVTSRVVVIAARQLAFGGPKAPGNRRQEGEGMPRVQKTGGKRRIAVGCSRRSPSKLQIPQIPPSIPDQAEASQMHTGFRLFASHQPPTGWTSSITRLSVPRWVCPLASIGVD